MQIAADTFRGLGPGPRGPLDNLFAITPDDGQEFPHVARMIYVGQGGDITLVARAQRDGKPNSANAVTLKNVPTGTLLNVWTRQVLQTGTTATNLVGGY